MMSSSRVTALGSTVLRPTVMCSSCGVISYRNIVSCPVTVLGQGPGSPVCHFIRSCSPYSIPLNIRYIHGTRGYTWHTWLNTSWTRTASAWSASGDTPCNQSQFSIVNTLTNDSSVLYLPPGPGWASTDLSMYIQPRPQEEVQADQADHSVTCSVDVAVTTAYYY